MLNTDKNPLFWAIQSSEQPQLTSILIIKTFYKQVKSYSNDFFFLNVLYKVLNKDNTLQYGCINIHYFMQLIQK